MTEALRFLALIELLGLAAAPLAAAALRRLPGAGPAFAKPLGLLLAAWLALAAVTAGLLPWGTGTIVLAAGVVALAGLVAWRRRPAGAPDAPARRLALAGEAVFLVAFAGMALLVAYSPDVWNTEKPMDMAIVNAINAGDALPPRDPWLAGEALNYYYLGHLAIAALVEVGGVEPTRGYNLGVALVFALTAAAAFGLGAALWAALAGPRRAVAAGLAAAALTAVLGNLDGARRLLADGGPLREFDWFGPSRVIPDTITEFPAFSFLLGDLHAHVLAIPVTLLVAALAVQHVLAGPRLAAAPVAALALGALYAINAWSVPVAAALLGLAVLARPPRGAGLRWGLAVAAGAVLVALPFALTYAPPPGGVGLVEERRGFVAFLRDQALLHGLLAWLLVALYAGRALAGRRPLRTVVWAGVAALVAGSLLAPADLVGAAALAALLAVAVHAALTRPDRAASRRSSG